MADEPETKLFEAMASAFPKIEGAIKDSDNDAFKRGGKATKYADLSSVVDAVKPALAEFGLFFCQLTHEQQGGVCIETVVGHKSGGRFSFGKLFVPASKNDAHGYGSALTYARRYSLMTAFGVCPEDDDGNAASLAPGTAKERYSMIDATQCAELRKMLKEADTSEEAFVDHIKCGTLPELASTNFERAKSVLQKRIDAMKEDRNGAEK